MNALRIIKVFVLLFVVQSGYLSAQTTYAYQTFEDTRIVNGQSIETNQSGILKFIISHRFGEINSGFENFFGLDNATMRIGLDYGITDWMTIGIGRSSNEQTVDGFLKTKLLYQCSGEKNMPISAALFLGTAMKAEPWPDDNRDYLFAHRMYYTAQLLIARKFSDRFSMQIMPSYVHRNLVDSASEANDIYAIGIAPKVQVAKFLAIGMEYYFVPEDLLGENYQSALSFGFDIKTKGHVFQLHVSNSRGMTEKFFIGETMGEWDDGDIHFGFNITRDFRIKGRKHR